MAIFQRAGPQCSTYSALFKRDSPSHMPAYSSSPVLSLRRCIGGYARRQRPANDSDARDNEGYGIQYAQVGVICGPPYLVKDA